MRVCAHARACVCENVFAFQSVWPLGFESVGKKSLLSTTIFPVFDLDQAIFKREIEIDTSRYIYIERERDRQTDRDREGEKEIEIDW